VYTVVGLVTRMGGTACGDEGYATRIRNLPIVLRVVSPVICLPRSTSLSVRPGILISNLYNVDLTKRLHILCKTYIQQVWLETAYLD
jgi:hypothetical protein